MRQHQLFQSSTMKRQPYEGNLGDRAHFGDGVHHGVGLLPFFGANLDG